MKNCDSKLVKLKIQIGNSPLFGPGKVLLLEAINDTGSISAGAKKIGMSYRKAWRLTNELNKLSKNKIINTNTGGKGVGGAYLTNFGKTFHLKEGRNSKTMKRHKRLTNDERP